MTFVVSNVFVPSRARVGSGHASLVVTQLSCFVVTVHGSYEWGETDGERWQCVFCICVVVSLVCVLCVCRTDGVCNCAHVHISLCVVRVCASRNHLQLKKKRLFLEA